MSLLINDRSDVVHFNLVKTQAANMMMIMESEMAS